VENGANFSATQFPPGEQGNYSQLRNIWDIALPYLYHAQIFEWRQGIYFHLRISRDLVLLYTTHRSLRGV
jgi:hypothetical protein